MAYDGATNKASFVAATTFPASALYKGVVVNSSGHVVIPTTSTGTDADHVIGTLYSVTATTSGAGVEAVTVGLGPIVKVNMASSTRSVGDKIGFSINGLGVVPTTAEPAWGVIVKGSSGSAGRIASVIRI